MGALASFLLIILVLIIIGAFFMYLRHRAKLNALSERYGYKPSHIELYFEEYFGEIIDNWDLVKDDKARRWADDMDKRLDEISKELDQIRSNKDMIDTEFDRIEDRIEDIERKAKEVEK